MVLAWVRPRIFGRWRRVFLRFVLFRSGVLTYLPHKAVAEVSKDKEPIGRRCVEFN